MRRDVGRRDNAMIEDEMKSPGHKQWPDHQVIEKRLERRVRVTVDGEVIADSRSVIEVDEDENPARFYIPREDVRMDMLERTESTSKCPFKGTASYYRIRAGDETLEDAAWTYEDPFDEHRALKDRLAFWDEKFPALKIEIGEEGTAAAE